MGVAAAHSGQWTDLWSCLLGLTEAWKSPSLTMGQLWFPGSHQIKKAPWEISSGYEDVGGYQVQPGYLGAVVGRYLTAWRSVLN